MSHLGLIIGNAVRRVIGQSTEEELPRPRASRQRPSARRPGSLRLELNLKGEVLFRNPGVAGVVQPCPLANLAPLAFASCEIAENSAICAEYGRDTTTASLPFLALLNFRLG